MNGSHRPDGVLIAAGPSIRPGRHIDNAGLLDLAPTLLNLLGLPAVDMDGRILSELLIDPVSGIFNHHARATSRLTWTPQPELAYSHADAALLAGRLRSLGYLE